ncbi:MAG: flagellar biosynthesis protein FlhB [Acidaminococcales bacterium]|nr:flagellar biosynthesis protein FlhB [Acidaminococcales bacterium]
MVFDLQLFAGEKTEEATPKRKQEARGKGQVAKSVEINSAFIMLAAFYFLSLNGQYMIGELKKLMLYMFSEFGRTAFDVDSIQSLTLFMITFFLKIVIPLMLVIALIGLLINYLQVGFMFNPGLLFPDFSRINPMSGLSRIFFSKAALVNLVKSLLKIAIIGYFIYTFVEKQVHILPGLIGEDVERGSLFFGGLIIDLGFRVGAVMLVIAAFDYYYQWYTHRENLKMTKQEIKEEYKQTEGNPQIKSRIRSKQRELAMRRMMQEVPKADVVITNPTHFAVALKYSAGMPAPLVVAKGQDYIALKIKETANDSKVTIVENKSLARALYQTADIGEYIPFELYQAVAEVLAYVYKLKRRLA